MSDPDHHARLTRVLETILSWVATEHPITGELSVDYIALVKALERDGLNVDQAGRILTPGGTTPLSQLPLQELRDASAILEHLERLDRVGSEDPALVISSAKALIEATTKHVLEELEVEYDDKGDIPELVRAVQRALKLHPETIAPTKKGRETIVRVLSNLSQVAVGVAELRNEYGPDHGRTRNSRGLRPRHAHLAIGAATTYCRLLLETLADRR